jgi:hypothetical protein
MACRQSSSRPNSASYKTAWLLAQKLRRSMIDPQREPLEGVVEVDQTELPFRDSFFDPLKSGKILIAGAVEVIDRGTNQVKPRRKRAKIPGYAVWSHPSRRHPGQLRGFDRGVCAGQRKDRDDAAYRRAETGIASRLPNPAQKARLDPHPYFTPSSPIAAAFTGQGWNTPHATKCSPSNNKAQSANRTPWSTIIQHSGNIINPITTPLMTITKADMKENVRNIHARPEIDRSKLFPVQQ